MSPGKPWSDSRPDVLLPLDPFPQNFGGVPHLKNFVVVESGVFAFFLAVADLYLYRCWFPTSWLVNKGVFR